MAHISSTACQVKAGDTIWIIGLMHWPGPLRLEVSETRTNPNGTIRLIGKGPIQHHMEVNLHPAAPVRKQLSK